MPKTDANNGFTLIEILIVVAIIGILAAIAVPSYIGIQEYARRGTLINAANSNSSELQMWVDAVRNASSSTGNMIHLDTNGNGFLAPPDKTNIELATSGMVTTFVASKKDASPWTPLVPLWANGGAAANQNACDALASINKGRITICYSPAEDQTLTSVFVTGADDNGSIIFSKSVSAD